ncbi:MAG: hypothetical protein ABW092_03380 [Candidatus Thiodiazotropha sp.]
MFKETAKQTRSLSDELRLYCDELSEFSQRCERLCQALAEIAAHHESISSYAVRGMGHNANWLKYRVNDFNQRLQALYQRVLDEQRP